MHFKSLHFHSFTAQSVSTIVYPPQHDGCFPPHWGLRNAPKNE